jgi:hypothetical protein
MRGGIDQQVGQAITSAGNNPQALAQRYGQSKSLIDLLALQKLKSEKEDAKRQLAMQNQPNPQTIVEQREQELLGHNKQELLQQMGPTMNRKGQQEMQAMRQPQQPQRPNPAQTGIAQAAPPMKFQEGGMVPAPVKPTNALPQNKDALIKKLVDSGVPVKKAIEMANQVNEAPPPVQTHRMPKGLPRVKNEVVHFSDGGETREKQIQALMAKGMSREEAERRVDSTGVNNYSLASQANLPNSVKGIASAVNNSDVATDMALSGMYSKQFDQHLPNAIKDIYTDLTDNPTQAERLERIRQMTGQTPAPAPAPAVPEGPRPPLADARKPAIGGYMPEPGMYDYLLPGGVVEIGGDSPHWDKKAVRDEFLERNFGNATNADATYQAASATDNSGIASQLPAIDRQAIADKLTERADRDMYGERDAAEKRRSEGLAAVRDKNKALEAARLKHETLLDSQNDPKKRAREGLRALLGGAAGYTTFGPAARNASRRSQETRERQERQARESHEALIELLTAEREAEDTYAKSVYGAGEKAKTEADTAIGGALGNLATMSDRDVYAAVTAETNRIMQEMKLQTQQEMTDDKQQNLLANTGRRIQELRQSAREHIDDLLAEDPLKMQMLNKDTAEAARQELEIKRRKAYAQIEKELRPLLDQYDALLRRSGVAPVDRSAFTGNGVGLGAAYQDLSGFKDLGTE